MPLFYSERTTFSLFGLIGLCPISSLSPPSSPPPQKKKPKLLFLASKEKIVHCKPAFSKGHYCNISSYLYLHSFTSKSKFIFIAEAHADRLWSLS